MSISFEPVNALVGSTLVVHTQHGPVELTLAEATERPRRGLPASFRTPFSLVFHGPQAVQLVQDLYAVEHPALGRHEWMLVPIGPTDAAPDVPRYEAVFA